MRIGNGAKACSELRVPRSSRDRGKGQGLLFILVLVFWWGASWGMGQCPKHPVDVFELEQLYNQGKFDEIIKRGYCVDSLYEITRPRYSPSLEELTTADRFMHLYILTAY